MRLTSPLEDSKEHESTSESDMEFGNYDDENLEDLKQMQEDEQQNAEAEYEDDQFDEEDTEVLAEAFDEQELAQVADISKENRQTDLEERGSEHELATDQSKTNEQEVVADHFEEVNYLDKGGRVEDGGAAGRVLIHVLIVHGPSTTLNQLVFHLARHPFVFKKRL